jgi:hypothetical protein
MPFESGRSKTGGRQKGVRNKRTTELQAEVAKSGKTPLEHMLAVLHDESADKDRRDRMAVAAAPYIHPKLQVVDSTIRAAVVDVTALTAEERRQRARALILEAFAERPPRVVEGEYKVLAGRDVAADVAAKEDEKPPSTISST